MEEYVNALLIAIPSFTLLVLIEIGYGHYKGFQTYSFYDALPSLTSGMTQIIKNSLEDWDLDYTEKKSITNEDTFL